jgi:magnesium transporter
MLDLKNGLPPLRGDDGAIRAEFVERVANAVDAGDVAALRTLVGDLHESDLGALLVALKAEQRPRLVELLGIDFDFTALTEMDDAVRDEILEELRPETVAEGVRDIESDDAVALLADMPRADRAEILDQIPALERHALTRALDYPEDSAGRRMQSEFIAVPPQWDVGQTIDYMRETADLPERFYELYVVDRSTGCRAASARCRLPI